MNKTTLGAILSLVVVGASLAFGVAITGADGTAPTVTTVLGFIGVIISQLLGNRASEDVKQDLRNGAFERLLREALDKLARENGTPLEVRNDSPPDAAHTPYGKEER